MTRNFVLKTNINSEHKHVQFMWDADAVDEVVAWQKGWN